jgi:hypothetical protein
MHVSKKGGILGAQSGSLSCRESSWCLQGHLRRAPDTWQPREALEKKLRGVGWQIRCIKTDDGCDKG